MECRVSLIEKITTLLGPDAVLERRSGDEPPRVAPAAPDAVALLLATANAEGWHVRVEGAGSWMPGDAPADLILTTRRLDRIPAVESQDLTVTAEAGVGLDVLRRERDDRGASLALDPPGLAGRSLGSVVATATAGPLRLGFGGGRESLVGLAFLAGEGRLIQRGGRVMKNVAGYDPTRLETGAFGAFGVVVLAHL